MATPKKHYFRHDFSCHTKPDFEYLRLKGGSEFYGAYWLLAEKCGISTTDNPSETFVIKREVLRRFLKFSDKKLTKFLEICSETSEKPLVFVEKSQLSKDSLKITVRKLLIFMNSKPEKGPIDRIGEDKIRKDKKGKETGKPKIVIKKFSINEIESIYDIYPTKDINNENRSTSKSLKDKEKIMSLLASEKFTIDSFKSYIKNHVNYAKKTQGYLQNFSTFLNQLPEVPDLKEETQATNTFKPPPDLSPEEKAAASKEASKLFDVLKPGQGSAKPQD